MENNEHTQLTDKLEIHFFELPKLIDPENDNKSKGKADKPKNMSSEELWLRMLSAKRKEDFDMVIAEDNYYVNQGIIKLLTMNTDEKFRDYMRERNKWEHDYLASMSKAKRIGRKEGKEEGREETEKFFLNRLKSMGFDDETIAEIFNKN